MIQILVEIIIIIVYNNNIYNITIIILTVQQKIQFIK